jgi:L-alanine-DL-glutamate epimerase-like enolase superfamily enzyme
MPLAAVIGAIVFALWQVSKKYLHKPLDDLPPQIQATCVTIIAVGLSIAANRLGLPVDQGDAVAAALSAIGVHGITKLSVSPGKESEGDGAQ